MNLVFRLYIRNVPMIEVRGVWIPNIDLNVLQKVVLLALAHHSADLTGNQIRFIRLWLGLTQEKFGRLFGILCFLMNFLNINGFLLMN
jgi:hypothetical protein